MMQGDFFFRRWSQYITNSVIGSVCHLIFLTPSSLLLLDSMIDSFIRLSDIMSAFRLMTHTVRGRVHTTVWRQLKRNKENNNPTFRNNLNEQKITGLIKFVYLISHYCLKIGTADSDLTNSEFVSRTDWWDDTETFMIQQGQSLHKVLLFVPFHFTEEWVQVASIQAICINTA